MGYKTLLQRIILYVLVAAYIASFVATLVISIILSTSTIDMSNALNKHDGGDHEKPTLGQFGPISTVVLLIGIPFLILVTLGVYVYFLSMSKSKKTLMKF